MSSVVRFKPFASFDASFEGAFDDLMRKTFGESDTATWVPAADVSRDGADAVITLEVPGVAPSDIEVEVKDRMLLVRGSRTVGVADQQDAGVQVVRREIRRGSFSRAFRLPGHVSAESVTASYDQGLLTVRVPEVQPASVSRRVPVEAAVRPQEALEGAGDVGAGTDGDGTTS